MDVLQKYEAYKNSGQREPNSPLTSLLSDVVIDNERIEALLRKKDSQINALRDKLFEVEQKVQTQDLAAHKHFIYVSLVPQSKAGNFGESNDSARRIK